MSDVFRTRIEPSVEPEIVPQGMKPIEGDKLAGIETKASEPLEKEQLNLDIWEGEHKRKFVTEYFEIGNIDGEFNLKMDTSVIDKYIKEELSNRKYEKNVDNWKAILSEIEEEIGSNRMELFSRIKKIAGYIKAITRLNEAKRKKELYLESFTDSKSS